MVEADFGPESVAGLVESGLVFPEIPPGAKLRNFEIWLAQNPTVFVPPNVPQRLQAETLPADLTPVAASGPTLEADGLEWLLRLAVAHQILQGGPVRRTQTRDFFKRDLDRVRGETLLGAPPSDALDALPDADLFTVALALAVGMFQESDGEVRTTGFPASWSAGLVRTLGELWSALPNVADWGPVRGWEIRDRPVQPFGSTWLYALTALGAMPAEDWVLADEIEKRIASRHPYFADAKDPSSSGVTRFLLAIAFPMRLVQATKTPTGYAVRLSPLGRQVLHLGGAEVALPTFPKALLVQPNLEILAYRQGLTTELIPQIGGFATWKTIGAALHTLQLPSRRASTRRALEGGRDAGKGIVRADAGPLRHEADAAGGARCSPDLVEQARSDHALSVGGPLRVRDAGRSRRGAEPGPAGGPADRSAGGGAAGERRRLQALPPDRDPRLFAAAGALRRGRGGRRVLDRRPGPVRSAARNRTAAVRGGVDAFGAAGEEALQDDRRISCGAARQQAGMSWAVLEAWFEQRTGMPGSPAARFLFGATDVPPLEFRRQIVLHVAAAETADGILQWPGTQTYVQGRLGPTALVIAEHDVEPLAAVLRDLGIGVRFEQV